MIGKWLDPVGSCTTVHSKRWLMFWEQKVTSMALFLCSSLVTNVASPLFKKMKLEELIASNKFLPSVSSISEPQAAVRLWFQEIFYFLDVPIIKSFVIFFILILLTRFFIFHGFNVLYCFIELNNFQNAWNVRRERWYVSDYDF